MQRTAQDWLVLTQLSSHSASSLGAVMALQFGPQLFLLPITGFTADHVDRRKLLCITQASMAGLALGLGLLTLTGVVELWHVYVFALLHGCAGAFDSPARQTFVSDLVTEAELSNAVALNSTSFNSGRLLGPATAGLLIGALGTGWVFVLNAVSFGAVLVALGAMRPSELQSRQRPHPSGAGLSDGFAYVWQRRDLRLVFAMLFLVSTFGLNLAIFISTMSVRVFHLGSEAFGVLASLMAVGSICGALLSARRARPRAPLLPLAAGAFGLTLACAAVTPSTAWFGFSLVLLGVAAQTFSTTANAVVQLATEPAKRGRVMAIFLAIALGCTLLGAPIVGWVADAFGPRWALGVGALGGITAALLGRPLLRRAATH
jgi:MFS family permease